jgi:alanine dehydrogenase
MRLRTLTANDIRRALPMSTAIEAMKEAFAQLSTGKAEMPLRGRIDLPAADGFSLFMPAMLSQSNDLAIKIVSVFPSNPSRGLPTIHALVVAIEPSTGRPLALLEGAALTAIRTGAASGAATDVLALEDASLLAVIGAGVQARTQLEAVCCVRPIKKVRIFSLDRHQSEELAESVSGRSPIPDDIEVSDNPGACVADADVVCTATTSRLPVFDGHLLKPGAHINAIGSFTPEMQEIDSETLRRSLVVVDSRQAVLAESGDLLIPIGRGEFSPEKIHAELGEILTGRRPGRQETGQITLFKSVGVAVQDAAAAGRAIERAESQALGQIVTL